MPFRWPVRETGKIALSPLPPCPVDARCIATTTIFGSDRSAGPKWTMEPTVCHGPLADWAVVIYPSETELQSHYFEPSCRAVRRLRLFLGDLGHHPASCEAASWRPRNLSIRRLAMTLPTFADRREAGQRLAPAVAAMALDCPLVLALPRGGVPGRLRGRQGASRATGPAAGAQDRRSGTSGICHRSPRRWCRSPGRPRPGGPRDLQVYPPVLEPDATLLIDRGTLRSLLP